MHGLDLVKQREAVEPRTLHPDIEKDETRDTISDRRQRTVGIKRRPRFMSLVVQNARDKLANVLFVVDDENIRRHC
jgi:hypothetical protein